MVCKRDVLSWFKELNIFKRLDFVCALMDCCNPIELRFLGTYVEDLGRKDYDKLREFQINASNVQYLSKLTDVNDMRTLDKMLTSLALMDSTFKEGAEVIFDILKQHTDSILYSYQTSVSIERVLLLAVMAVNHPAFEFSQKQELRTQLSVLLKAVEVNSPCNQCDDIPSCDPVEEATGCSEVILSGQGTIHSNKVFVQSIKVNGLNRSSDNRYEYTFQITWSDNSVTSVSKTHVQLFEFQCKLLNLFPEQAGEHKSMMPYLQAKSAITSNVSTTLIAIHEHSMLLPSGKRISSTAHKGELAEKTLPDIEEYVRQLTNLPQHILQCPHVVSFFCPSMLSSPANQTVIPNVESDQNIVPDQRCNAVDYQEDAYYDQSSVEHTTDNLVKPGKTLRCMEQPDGDYSQEVCHKDSEVNVEVADGYHVPTEPCQLSKSSDNSNKLVYTTTVASPILHAATNIPANLHHLQSMCPQGSLDSPRSRRDGLATSPRVSSNAKIYSRSSSAWPAYNQAMSSHVLYSTQLQVVPYATTVASDMVAPLIQEWLKKQRLHKYNGFFQGMTVEQVLKLSEQQIDSWDIVTGAKGRIKTQLEQLRKNGFSELNGLAPNMTPYFPGHGNPNRMYYGPVHHGLYSPPDRLAHPHGLTMPIRQTSETNSSDASPQSSSSDENERDSEGSDNSGAETNMASNNTMDALPTSTSSSVTPVLNIATLQTPGPNTNCISPGASPQLSPVQLSQPTLKRTNVLPVNDDNAHKMNLTNPIVTDVVETNAGHGHFSKQPENRKSVDCAHGKVFNNKMPVYSSSVEYRLNPAPVAVEPTGQELRYPCYSDGMNRTPAVGCVTNSCQVNRVDITFGNVPISLASPCGRSGDMPQLGSGAVGSNIPPDHTQYSVTRTMYSSPSSQTVYPTNSQHQNRASSETYIAPTTVTFSTTTAPVLALGNNTTYSNESTLGVTYNNNHTTYGTNSVLTCTTCNSSMPCGNAPPHSNLHVPYNSYVAQGAIPYQNFSNYYPQGGMIPQNSLLNQGIQSSPRYSNVPPPPFQNNIQGELAAYGNGHYGLVHQHGPMYVGMGLAGHRPGPAAAHHGHMGNPAMVSAKKLTCYNCGLPGHKATECREQGMQSLTQQSQYNLNFKPIEQSDTTKS